MLHQMGGHEERTLKGLAGTQGDRQTPGSLPGRTGGAVGCMRGPGVGEAGWTRHQLVSTSNPQASVGRALCLPLPVDMKGLVSALPFWKVCSTVPSISIYPTGPPDNGCYSQWGFSPASLLLILQPESR